MAMTSFENVDIDLFADDKGDDFPMDEFAFEGEGMDIYDDVVSPDNNRRDSVGSDASPTSSRSVKSISKSSSRENGDSRSQPVKKHQVFVGNLTWWTTDEDIVECVHAIGVNDFVDFKFYENKTNGLSKGYGILTVGSDASLKLIKENMSKTKIHEKFPRVTPPTKTAQSMFESLCITGPSQQSGAGVSNNNNMMCGGPRGPGPMNQIGGFPMDTGGYGPRMMCGPPEQMQMNRGPPPGYVLMGPPNQQGGFGHHQYIPRNMGPHYSQHQQPPFQQQEGLILRSSRGPYFPNQGPQHPRGGGGMHPYGSRMMTSRGPPRGDWQLRSRPPISQGMLFRPPLTSTPIPHMNREFFQGAGPPQPYINNNIMNNSPINRVRSVQNYPTDIPPADCIPPPVMSELEFDDIMGRNKAVSSLALTRAGEFAGAIETLVTAISLIKQSKVANDDRCKILLSALQETLRGVEDKSYGSKSKERSRSSEKEKEKERHRRRSGERSRSHDRKYRERSRDRYYEYPRERSERSKSRERGDYTYRTSSREESSSGRYYDESRYREREREPEIVYRTSRH